MYNGWLCPWRILETVNSSLETFSILKEKFFNPEYNTDIKHSGNLMEHQILYITLLFHNDTYPKHSGNQMCKCVLFILYIWSRTVYDHIINNIYCRLNQEWFYCVGVIVLRWIWCLWYVTLSVYPHREGLKNMPWKIFHFWFVCAVLCYSLPKCQGYNKVLYHASLTSYIMLPKQFCCCPSPLPTERTPWAGVLFILKLLFRMWPTHACDCIIFSCILLTSNSMVSRAIWRNIHS
jgi:hypothetical protein